MIPMADSTDCSWLCFFCKQRDRVPDSQLPKAGLMSLFGQTAADSGCSLAAYLLAVSVNAIPAEVNNRQVQQMGVGGCVMPQDTSKLISTASQVWNE